MILVQQFSLLISISCVLVDSTLLDNSGNEYMHQTVPDLIAEEKYPVETHWVTTPDGYNLCMHRIPNGKKGKSNGRVAFLMHGLVCTSSDWIILGAKKSLAYNLADNGYDVWMGNARGNFYSRNHTTLNPDKDEIFWDFSWNEIATIDLPTMIDYALNKTGADAVYFAGHSQGTTVIFVMASEKPEYNKKIKIAACLAPIGYLNGMASIPLQLLSSFQDLVGAFTELFGIHEILPRTDLVARFCGGRFGRFICTFVVFFTLGFDWSEADLTTAPRIFANFPAGAAFKQVLHYAQEVRSGEFRKFDYGTDGNLEKYNTSSPPRYDLGKITAPMYFYYGSNDFTDPVENVEKLYGQLGNPVGKYLAKGKNHFDPLYAKNFAKIITDKIINLFRRYR